MSEPEATPQETLSLSDLRPGTKARIVKIAGRGTAHRRLSTMGLTRGTTLELVRVAPLGDPIEIKVRGYLLSLRKEEAASVIVSAV